MVSSESYLKNLQRFGIKPGLERIRAMMELAQNPHLTFPSILIGGTNGKGSTVSFLSTILQSSGLKVGVYTSPHLVTYRERFRINDALISQEKFDELLIWAKSLAEQVSNQTSYGEPTEFEVLTAIAFRYFADEKVDIAVVEVGLGGRWDATNILEPLVSVLTIVGLDHTDRLGPDHFTIAKDKLGIARPKRPLVTAEHKFGVLRLIEATCTELNSRLIHVGTDVTWRTHSSSEGGTEANFKTWLGNYEVKLGMLGTHQLPNFGCALAVVELLRGKGWEISDEAIIEGAQNAKCQGRLQLVRVGDLRILLDGAHNPSGASTLARALRTIFRFRKLMLVTGILRDKDAVGIVSKLVPLADKVFVTQPQTERALPAKTLAQICQPFGKEIVICETVEDALKLAMAETEQDDLICVTGSLYVIGEALALLEFSDN
ncbi:MAG: bifunctional folylpolyglutamate synthase/dihydrofolate synthase [Armatimonadetes bacterium]|nr:bifunctional folylpolyglutamate synthase/dihydrofolate synthase [Armatimonadota bacterium]MDW8027764.1 folylpolyglutamate synthase/dihydrofolate synthase family protein [Armatimonadota bacterium]